MLSLNTASLWDWLLLSAIGSSGVRADDLMALPSKPVTSATSIGIASSDSQFHSAAYAAFRAVFDSSNEALVIISQKGAIQTANPRAQ